MFGPCYDQQSLLLCSQEFLLTMLRETCDCLRWTFDIHVQGRCPPLCAIASTLIVTFICALVTIIYLALIPLLDPKLNTVLLCHPHTASLSGIQKVWAKWLTILPVWG